MSAITVNFTTPSDSLSGSPYGIKADTLSQLSTLGFQIPVWMTIPSTAFSKHVPNSILEQSPEEITSFIKDIELDSSLISSIHNWIYDNGLDEELFAVRSSICTDKTFDHTYAGQLKTHLCVRINELPEAILNIWASPFSSKASAYRAQWSITPASVRIAVILQKMISSEASGAAMCFDPSTGSRSAITISSAYGINDNSSNLRTDCDLYTVNFSGTSPYRISKIYEKKNRVIPNQLTGSGTTIAPVPYAMRSRSSLSTTQIMTLATITRALSTKTAKPQIIDWALSDGKFYILQSRAVASLENIPDTTEPSLQWQTSSSPLYNSDYISPLIYSIIKKCNAEAFQAFYNRSLQDKRKAKKDTDFLGYINGHIYVDEKVHDDLMSVLPFGFANTSRMKGPSPFAEVTSYYKMTKDINNVEKELKKLLCSLKNDLHYRSFLDYKFSELLDSYLQVEKQLNNLWKHLIVNHHYINALCDLYFDSSRKQHHQLQDLFNQSSATTTNASILDELMNICTIADAIRFRPSMKRLFEKCSTSEIRKQLGLDAAIAPSNDDVSTAIIRKLINKHIEASGCSLAELTDFISDSKKLDTTINVLRIYTQNDITKSSLFLTNEKNKTSSKSDNMPTFSISKMQKRYVSSKLNMLYTQRVSLNKILCSRLSQMKQCIQLLGKKLFAEGLISESEDIQYLTTTELNDYIRGRSVTSNLKPLISIRKQEHQVHGSSEDNKEPLSTHGIVYHSIPEPAFNNNMQNILLFQGIGNEVDAVTGNIIMEEQLLKLKLDFLKNAILVIRDFNPKWIPYLPLIKGLIIQKGSPDSELSQACSILKIPMVFIENSFIREFRNDEQVELDSHSGKISILTKN